MGNSGTIGLAEVDGKAVGATGLVGFGDEDGGKTATGSAAEASTLAHAGNWKDKLDKPTAATRG
jgi:hypothetical protein